MRNLFRKIANAYIAAFASDFELGSHTTEEVRPGGSMTFIIPISRRKLAQTVIADRCDIDAIHSRFGTVSRG